jgi:hypothetical protein
MSERRTNDAYPTPVSLARLGWALAQRYVPDRTALRVCEPGCGDAQPFLAAADADPRVIRLDGFDLRPVHLGDWPRGAGRATIRPGVDWTGELGGDGAPWDVIITNPPFSIAEAFARRSLPRLAPSGVLVLLVRLSFLASEGRRGFWADHPLSELAVIRPRPSFTGDGHSDPSEYAYAVWAPALGQAPTITWVDWEKPRAVRRATGPEKVDMLI